MLTKMTLNTNMSNDAVCVHYDEIQSYVNIYVIQFIIHGCTGRQLLWNVPEING